ncbi:MAG: hypothetical protein RMK91_05405 [Pseudanabaenaceae cyanobacterium SKYGB_i_bin29]|nr:hypothetical protein [Pseudanabaenaceae cyanobacterium SKYGB_i_bin29]
MGWLIDPTEKVVFVFCPRQELLVLDDPDALIPVPAFADSLELPVKDLFSWLPE